MPGSSPDRRDAWYEGARPGGSPSANWTAIQGRLNNALLSGFGNIQQVELMNPGTYKIDGALAMYSDTTLVLGPGVILDASSLSVPCITATSKSNIQLCGDGKILCVAASAPSFTSCTGLGVSVRIESADGSALTYAGTGNTLSALPADMVTPINDSLRLKLPRVLKQFNNLNNITFSDSVISSTRVIDQSSPFGRPGLKLTLTSAGSGGYTEVRFAGANIDNFDDHIVWRVWVDNYTRLSQTQLFVGNDSSYTKLQTYTINSFNNNTALFSGPRVLIGGPQSTSTIASGGTFVYGTDTFVASKVRFTIPANVECVIWVDAIEIPARQRPIVCITFDDADDSLYSAAYPVLTENGIKATFGINTTDIDASAAFITTAQVQALSAAGHQVAAHNQTNSKLRTLYSAGILNGTNPIEPDAYLAQYVAACNILEGLGIPYQDFCYHPWVQGGFDGAAMQDFRAAGVQIARSTNRQDAAGTPTAEGSNIYGSGFGNYAMAMGWLGMGSLVTLSAAQTALANAIKYGTIWMPSFHALDTTASDTVTWAASDFESFTELLALYKARGQVDVLTVRELSERLLAMGVLDGKPLGFVPDASARVIGHLSAANFNVTTDQAITLTNGAQSWSITDIIVTNVTVNLTAADGGVYTAASKGGTAIVDAAQVYTALTGTATQILRLTIASAGPVSTTLYFSLTGAQGGAATGDIFVFGKPV